MRPDELLARIGGDELIGLFHASGLKELDARIERVSSDLREHPLRFGQSACALSFSYGCAELLCDGIDLNQLYNAADIRMYAHKRRSRQE